MQECSFRMTKNLLNSSSEWFEFSASEPEQNPEPVVLSPLTQFSSFCSSGLVSIRTVCRKLENIVYYCVWPDCTCMCKHVIHVHVRINSSICSDVDEGFEVVMCEHVKTVVDCPYNIRQAPGQHGAISSRTNTELHRIWNSLERKWMRHSVQFHLHWRLGLSPTCHCHMTVTCLEHTGRLWRK